MMFEYGERYYIKREKDRRHLMMAIIMDEICCRNGLPTKSFMDVGCASGCLLHAIRKINQDAMLTGIDHGEVPRKRFMLVDDPRANFIDFDLDTVNKHTHISKFNVVSSIEVIEHIDPKSENGLVEFFAKATGGLLFVSAARVGQRGYGHVNCASRKHWIDLFDVNGMEFKDTMTEECCKMMEVMRTGEPANMMVFAPVKES